MARAICGWLWQSNRLLRRLRVYSFTAVCRRNADRSARSCSRPASFIPIDLVFDAANNLWIVYEEGNQPESDAGAVQMYPAAESDWVRHDRARRRRHDWRQGTCSILTICMPQALAFDQGGNLWISQRFTIFRVHAHTTCDGEPLACSDDTRRKFCKTGKGANAISSELQFSPSDRRRNEGPRREKKCDAPDHRVGCRGCVHAAFAPGARRVARFTDL